MQPILVIVEHKLATKPVVTASIVGVASGMARKETFTASKTVACERSIHVSHVNGHGQLYTHRECSHSIISPRTQ